MTERKRWAIVALWMCASHGPVGCAASSGSQSEPAYSSSGGASTTAEQATVSRSTTESDDSATRSAPTVDYTTATSTTGTSAPRAQTNGIPGTRPPATAGSTAPEQPVPMVVRDEQIAQWQSRLAAIEVQLQASAGVCRDVCRATDAICHASRELCSLTGDREGAPPTDPRCARARVSCERAARQRQENCTSCPSE